MREMIRAATADDVDAIKRLALDNAMFAPEEMDDFDEMLSGYLTGTLTDHTWIVLESPAGEVAGAACFAPEPFADRLWNLYFIASRPGEHRSGIGRALITQVEDTLRERRGVRPRAHC